MENKEETLNVNEIVKIEQLPIIYQQLELVGKYLEKELSGINELECNEDNKQIVKNKRTEINNTLTTFENKRKEIKNQCLEEYSKFEDKYNIEVKSKLQDASNTLSNKIMSIEDEQKSEKENELRKFANEYFINKHIEDVVVFEDIGLNITLSASEKSLKDKIVMFCDKIASELELINLEDYKEEIMLEYKANGFDLTRAKLVVIQRHKQIEEMQQQIKKVEEQKQEEQKVIENVETMVSSPVEIKEEEKYANVTITLKNVTKSQIIEIQNYLKEKEIEYE